ncbi:hypothetical protein [Campylobacter majalis]|uniref:hypothetical protein n=1 Tax=Campylobacter majalis TaxID=2790656 RepID=UPI001E4866F3|nr:hypothetical protein [Campylobacter majalis]
MYFSSFKLTNLRLMRICFAGISVKFDYLYYILVKAKFHENFLKFNMMGVFLIVWFLTSLRSLQDDSLNRYPYEKLLFAGSCLA